MAIVCDLLGEDTHLRPGPRPPCGHSFRGDVTSSSVRLSLGLLGVTYFFSVFNFRPLPTVLSCPVVCSHGQSVLTTQSAPSDFLNHFFVERHSLILPRRSLSGERAGWWYVHGVGTLGSEPGTGVPDRGRVLDSRAVGHIVKGVTGVMCCGGRGTEKPQRVGVGAENVLEVDGVLLLPGKLVSDRPRVHRLPYKCYRGNEGKQNVIFHKETTCKLRSLTMDDG